MRRASRPLVFFLSDYGVADEFVGVCKAVVLGIAPHAVVTDLTHEVPPHDIRSGAHTLERALGVLPASVVFAVVDPGVGTDRRAVAVEAGRYRMVGPDNGLLAPAIAVAGGARRAVSLTDTRSHRRAPGLTFAGRDVMAPAVAHLAMGRALRELGEPIDPATLVPLSASAAPVDASGLGTEVTWVDRFGNCQLGATAADLRARGAQLGGPVAVELGNSRRDARWVPTYGALEVDELGVVVDSYGRASLACRGRSAAEELGIGPGRPVILRPPSRDASGAEGRPPPAGR